MVSPLDFNNKTILGRFMTKKNPMADYHAQTQQNLAVIDQQLNTLVDVTAQNKVMANQMNAELKDQNRMIGEINDKMDRANDQVVKATEEVEKVRASKSACISWVVMVLLIIAIIITWVV